MQIHLRKRHFEKAYYVLPDQCAVALAVKEIITADKISEGVWNIRIEKGDSKNTYKHGHYSANLNQELKDKALRATYDDDIIYTLDIPGLENELNSKNLNS